MSVSLRISEVRGPDAVQNGTTSRLVLDCIFDGNENDLRGLLVKWFFNRSPYPVYQWIPGVKPQVRKDFHMYLFTPNVKKGYKFVFKILVLMKESCRYRKAIIPSSNSMF